MKHESAPEGLGKHGKLAWDYGVAWLQEKGLFEDVDHPLLESFCFAVDMLKEAEKDIKKNGIKLTHTNKMGATNVQSNPAITTYKHFYDVVLNSSKRFGFNPLDRKGLDVDIKSPSGFSKWDIDVA